MTKVEVATGYYVTDPEYGGSWRIETDAVGKVAVADLVEVDPPMNERHAHYADWDQQAAPFSLFD